MKKIVLIGEIKNFDKPTGPGNVVKNLILELKNSKNNYEYINSYCSNSFDKIKLICKFIKILFSKNLIINVHSFGYSVPLLIYYISKFNKKNQYYLTLHGVYSVEQTFEFGQKIDCKILKKERKLISKFPKIICVSQFLKKYINDNYNRIENVYVAYNAIDMSYAKENKSTLSKDTIKVISAGGISNRKSVLEMVDLMIYLNKNISNYKIELNIYGSICNKELYEEFKQKINGINNINYHGSINFSELMDEYYNSHFLLALTKFDTFNLTVLESMLQFTPAIVSNQAGVAELIENNNNGYIIDMNDNYMEKIKDIIDSVNTDNYENVRINAYQTASVYNTKKMFDKYIQIFECDM